MSSFLEILAAYELGNIGDLNAIVGDPPLPGRSAAGGGAALRYLYTDFQRRVYSSRRKVRLGLHACTTRLLRGRVS